MSDISPLSGSFCLGYFLVSLNALSLQRKLHSSSKNFDRKSWRSERNNLDKHSARHCCNKQATKACKKSCWCWYVACYIDVFSTYGSHASSVYTATSCHCLQTRQAALVCRSNPATGHLTPTHGSGWLSAATLNSKFQAACCSLLLCWCLANKVCPFCLTLPEGLQNILDQWLCPKGSLSTIALAASSSSGLADDRWIDGQNLF